MHGSKGQKECDKEDVRMDLRVRKGACTCVCDEEDVHMDLRGMCV